MHDIMNERLTDYGWKGLSLKWSRVALRVLFQVDLIDRYAHQKGHLQT